MLFFKQSSVILATVCVVASSMALPATVRSERISKAFRNPTIDVNAEITDPNTFLEVAERDVANIDAELPDPNPFLQVEERNVDVEIPDPNAFLKADRRDVSKMDAESTDPTEFLSSV